MGTREEVYRLLDTEGPLTGEELGERLGVSRAAVWKHVEALREEGYQIETKGDGYVLGGGGGLMNEMELRKRLDTELLGSDIVVEETVSSTNDEAKRLAREGAGEGTVILAEEQRGGKGRIGKRWESPKGGLYLSVVLRPEMGPAEAPKITLMAGLAVARALRDLGVDAGIQWSNDLVVDGRKIAGILTEMAAEEDAVQYVVLGIGIDANLDLEDLPKELREDSATLMEEVGEEVDLRELAASVLENLEEVYLDLREEGFRGILNDWRDLSETIGTKVKVETQREKFIGLAVGLSESGALIVELPDGELKRVTGGLCSHLESY